MMLSRRLPQYDRIVHTVDAPVFRQERVALPRTRFERVAYCLGGCPTAVSAVDITLMSAFCEGFDPQPRGHYAPVCRILVAVLVTVAEPLAQLSHYLDNVDNRHIHLHSAEMIINVVLEKQAQPKRTHAFDFVLSTERLYRWLATPRVGPQLCDKVCNTHELFVTQSLVAIEEVICS